MNLIRKIINRFRQQASISPEENAGEDAKEYAQNNAQDIVHVNLEGINIDELKESMNNVQITQGNAYVKPEYRVAISPTEYDKLANRFPQLVCSTTTTPHQMAYLAGVHAVLATLRDGWVV